MLIYFSGKILFVNKGCNMKAIILKACTVFLLFSNILYAHNPTVQTTLTAFKHASNLKYILQPTFYKLGNHMVIEFFGCINLNEETLLKTILRKAAETANATVLSITTHQFEPEGVTGVAVLQESHISVHTWPEYEYAAIDIFTCGQHVIIEKALEILESFFRPKRKQVLKISRGFDNENV
jgi:S-adenosylmethionine decarboxylase